MPGPAAASIDFARYANTSTTVTARIVLGPTRRPLRDPGFERDDRQRDRQQASIGTRQTDQHAPAERLEPFAPPEVIDRARRSEQEERLGIERAVKERERIARGHPDRPPRGVLVEKLARELVDVDQRPEERGEHHQRTAPQKRRRFPAEQPAGDPRRHRQRREEHDVLLLRHVARLVAIAVDDDAHVPGRVPLALQIQELVLGEAQRRAIVVDVAEREHREVADKQDDRPRPHEREAGGAAGGRVPGRFDALRDVVQDRRTRREDVPEDRQHGGRREQARRRGQRDADAGDPLTKSSPPGDDQGQRDQQRDREGRRCAPSEEAMARLRPERTCRNGARHARVSLRRSIASSARFSTVMRRASKAPKTISASGPATRAAVISATLTISPTTAT